MKKVSNIFIWFSTFSEKFIFHEACLVYEFFNQNWYNLVKNAIESDFIILAWVPYNIFEQIKALLTINYYLKKYPNKKIITIGHLSDMIYWLKSFWNLTVVWYYWISEFDDMFEHNISINEIDVDIIRYFIPLKIEELYLVHMWHNIDIQSKYIFTEKDLKITVDNIYNWDYWIEWIGEYDWSYNYMEDISWSLYIQTSYWCWSKCSFCTVNKVWFLKSISIDKILNKVRKWLLSWKKIVYILDQDSWSYWIDLWNIDFSDLLNEINKIDMDFKVKLYAVEPSRWKKVYSKIDVSFFENRLDFINLPLQTSSQRILKLMNRHYNIQEIIDIAVELKKINKNLTIETSIIYWFPTETFEEFKDYFRLFKYFDYVEFMLFSEKNQLALSKIKKNSIEEVYTKYKYYLKVQKAFPNKIEESYFSNIDMPLVLKYLY